MVSSTTSPTKPAVAAEPELDASEYRLAELSAPLDVSMDAGFAALNEGPESLFSPQAASEPSSAAWTAKIDALRISLLL